MSKKRPYEHSTFDTQLVEIYDDLANDKENIRLKAAGAFSIKFSAENSPSSEQLSKALRRLIRGLCSSRNAARLGFSTALTEFLSQQSANTDSTHEFLQVSRLIDVLVKQTKVAGKVAGQEERDHHIGRVFGAGAFINSGVLLKDNVPADQWDRILDTIYEVARKKPWLREMSGKILYGAIQMISDGNHDPGFVQAIINKLVDSGLAKTPEGVAVWLKVQGHFPKVKLPTGIWRRENPTHEKEMPKLALILKEAAIPGRSGEEDAAILQKGSWTPKTHFVWNVVLADLMSEKPKAKTIRFKDFWQVAVDEHIFAPTSSAERKYWGFLLLQQLISSAPRLFLPDLFSTNVVRCLANQLASEERYVHLAAQKTVKSIMKRAKSEPSVASMVLRGLLASTSHYTSSFDHITRTKTVERLMALGDASSLRHLVPELRDRLVCPGVIEQKEASARRQVTIDQLTCLLKSRKNSTTQDSDSPDSVGLTHQVLEIMATYSYFSMEKPHANQDDCPVPPMSSRTQEFLKTRLTSCLSHILSSSSNPASFASQVVDVILCHEADKQMNSILELTGTFAETISHARTFLEDIHTRILSEPNNITTLHAFELLYSLTILQVYNGDADAVSILGDLRSSYETLIERRQIADQVGSEVIVEILLTFVAKPSQLFRRLARQVFTIFTRIIQYDGLRLLTKVLETAENLSGQDEMFEDDALHSFAASEDDGSDVEEVDMTNGGGGQSSSEVEDVSQVSIEDAEEDSSEEEDEEAAMFDAKLAQALKPEESTDEDMDDEQMEALDGPIASIFRERKKVVSKKKQKMDAKETIVNFKCRVLELLEIFVKQQHKEQLALDLLLPLLMVTRTTTSGLVKDRASQLMRDLSRICKGPAVPQINDQGAIVELLKEVHVEAMRQGSNAHASACSQASLLLVKVLVANDQENLRGIVKIYGDTQESMMLDPKCKVRTSFFTDWLNWCTTARAAK
ncbi:MAG: hypothetical protein Q9169_001873 [Polycauliona sp. 2 TL-2023]